MINHKFVFIIIILGTFVLSSCSNTSANYSKTYNPATDHQYLYQAQGAAIRIAAMEEGYYILHGNYIYYADKATMRPVLLDNNPNSDCLDVQERGKPRNCNAYVDIFEHYHAFLAYYNDKLYTVQRKYTLSGIPHGVEFIEMSKDGSKRKTILAIDSEPQAIALHRGVLYYDTRDYSKESELSYQIKRFEIEKPRAEPESIYRGDLPNGGIIDITPYGKYVYFLETYKGGYRTIRIDLETGQLHPMFLQEEGRKSYISGLHGDQVLFTYFFDDVEDKDVWVAYTSDLEGEHIEALPIQRDFLSNYYVDDTYIYARPTMGYPNLEKEEFQHVRDELTVYNAQFEVVDRIDTSFLPMHQFIVAGDERYMFVHYTTRESKRYVRYLDKTEIGTGKASFKPFIE